MIATYTDVYNDVQADDFLLNTADLSAVNDYNFFL